MRKKPTIRMKSKETAAEVFELFLLTKRADGVKPRTIETYKQSMSIKEYNQILLQKGQFIELSLECSIIKQYHQAN